MKTTSLTLISAILLASTMPATAGTLRVGKNKPYHTIQSAVDAASNGDTVLIDKGVYIEAVTVNKDLTIRPSKKGKKGKVIIDGEDSSLPLLLNSGADGCTISGLTLRNSGVQAGIQAVAVSNFTVSKCKVIGGTSTHGMLFFFSSGGMVSNNTVVNPDGIGIVGVTSNCTFRKNKVINPGMAGMQIQATFNTISKNTVIQAGGHGIEMGNASHGSTSNVVSNNHIYEASGDGIHVYPGSSNCSLLNNVVKQSASQGIEIESSSEHLLDSNRTFSNRSGIVISGPSSFVTLNRNTSKKSVYDNFDTGFNTASVYMFKNASRRAGDNGFSIEGTGHSLVNNSSKMSAQGKVDGLDFETSGAASCYFMGNAYSTSDF